MKTSADLLYLSIRLTILLFFVASCQNETSDTATDTGAVTDSTAASSTMRTEPPSPDPGLPYTAVFNDETDQLNAQPNADFDRSRLNVDTLTHLLLISYPQVELEVDRVANDTVYVQIADATYLTQQMGSSGAHMYLLEATYAYTELSGIHVVNFDFTEGDHAIPGAYTRKSFEDEKPIR